MNRLLSIIFSVVCTVISGLTVNAAKVDFKVQLDSAHLLMGKTMNLKLTIKQPMADAGIVIVPADSVPQIEFCQLDSLPALNLESSANGQNIFTAQYKIQAFDSGDYRIPPLAYINGGDTVFSNGVSLKVVPVDVSKLKDIHPIETVGRYESRWYDVLPDWVTDYWLIGVIILIVIAGAIVAYFIFVKKIPVNVLPKKKPIPPYNVAMMKLQELRSRNLWETGKERAFYTELTDILREYLDRRFGINAMEMTSTQIKEALNSNSETRLSRVLVEQVLEIADFVKFAKEQPSPQENMASFDKALQFVEDTKPQPAPDSTKSKESGNSADKVLSDDDNATKPLYRK